MLKYELVEVTINISCFTFKYVTPTRIDATTFYFFYMG
jgi:hypothetical protein